MATLNPNTIQYTGGANQGTAGSFKIKPDAYYDKLLLTMLRQMEFSYAKYAVEKTLPRNFGDTINWRRFNKLATTKTPLTEGVTPDGQTISGKEVTAVIAQYGNVMYFTDIIDLQQLDRVRQEYTVELGFQAKETMDEIVRDTLVSEGSAFFAGAAAATTELTSLVTHRVKVDDFRKIVLGMKRGFIGGNRKAAGKYVALVAPEIMFSLFEDQKTRDYMDFGQNNGMFNDGMIVDMFGIRFEEVLNAPMTEVGENFAHDSIVIGEEAYAITKLEGQSLKVITKGLGSAGVEDPLDQRQSIGWKMTGFASKVLNPEAVVNYWALAVDADDAEVEAPNFNYATTVIGGGGGEVPVATKTITLSGVEVSAASSNKRTAGFANYAWYNPATESYASTYSALSERAISFTVEVPEEATMADILSERKFIQVHNVGSSAPPVANFGIGQGYDSRPTWTEIVSSDNRLYSFSSYSFHRGLGAVVQEFNDLVTNPLTEVSPGSLTTGRFHNTSGEGNFGGAHFDNETGFDVFSTQAYTGFVANNIVAGNAYISGEDLYPDYGGDPVTYRYIGYGANMSSSFSATNYDSFFYRDEYFSSNGYGGGSVAGYIFDRGGYGAVPTHYLKLPDVWVIPENTDSLATAFTAGTVFGYQNPTGLTAWQQNITWKLSDNAKNSLDYVVPDGSIVYVGPAGLAYAGNGTGFRNVSGQWHTIIYADSTGDRGFYFPGGYAATEYTY